MSAAVMPMRKTVSAPAIRGNPAAHAIASIMTAALARPFADFSVRIVGNPFSTFSDYFLCKWYATAVPMTRGTAELLLTAQLLVIADQQKTQLPNLASTLHDGINYSNRSFSGA
jgi:hypothetical protein